MNFVKIIILFIVLPEVTSINCHEFCEPEADDCPSYPPNECDGMYCTYIKKVYLSQNNYTVIKRACTDIARIQPGPSYTNPSFTKLNDCTQITYGNIEYTLKICDDVNYCNAFCNESSYYHTSAPTISPTTSSTSSHLIIPIINLILLLKTII